MKTSFLKSADAVANRIFAFLSSLKLAVIVLLSIAILCAVATFLESLYDTPTAQYWVYKSFAFRLTLFMLGVNILAVALSRLPWKPRHTPFLLAHLGILLVLIGSWVTDRFGLDGSMRVSEEQVGTVVEINEPTLVLAEGEKVRSVPIRWTPPNAKFKPVHVQEYGLLVDQFIAHTDPDISFVPASAGDEKVAPALKLKLSAGPGAPPMMKALLNKEMWLWGGDPAWSTVTAGPAKLHLQLPETPEAVRKLSEQPGPQVTFFPKPDGSVVYKAQTSEGRVKSAVLSQGKIQGSEILPGWKGDVRISVEQWIPRATSHITYKPSEIQYGTDAPPSAIHLIAGQGEDARMWLGLGDRATLQFQGREVIIGYYPKRVVLPFGVRLERFQIDHYEGTRNPMEYSSRVKVIDSRPGTPEGQITISMNEPLEYGGITFYQSSYEEAEPRPVTSIFSVNQDPGRGLKYVGSLLIVLGSILLFVMRSFGRKGSKKPAAAAAEVQT